MSKPEKLLLLPDCHCCHQDDSAIDIAAEFNRDWGIADYVVQMGDLIDCRCVSSFKYNPEPLDQLDEYLAAREFWDKFPAKKRRFQIEGNHEHRFRRPDGIPFELFRMLQPKVWFELEKRRIEWVPITNDPKKVLKFGHLSVIHGFSYGKTAARNAAQDFGCCAQGHNHSISQMSGSNIFNSQCGFTIGTLSKQLPYEEIKGPTGHMQGFAFVYLFNPGFSLYQVRLAGNRVVIEGKMYTREQQGRKSRRAA